MLLMIVGVSIVCELDAPIIRNYFLVEEEDYPGVVVRTFKPEWPCIGAGTI